MATLIPSIGSARVDSLLRQRHRQAARGCDARARRRRPRASAHVSFLVLPDAAHSRHPAASESEYDTKRLAECVRTVDAEVLLGHIPGGQYDAVLIDEAHDFEPVATGTMAFLIEYDDMQAIYKGMGRPVWSQLGIEAKGRTRVLKVNYRNTVQILGLARRVAEEVVGAPGVAADDEDPVLVPEDAGRQGVEPKVRRCVSFEAEAHAIGEWLVGRRKAGYGWGQMAVLYPEHWIGEKFAQVLKKHEVPVDIVKENKNRVNLKRPAVRLLSMHAAKGLEFSCVAVGALGAVGRHEWRLRGRRMGFC
jgi:superfamily I DNA/RNA helicase